MKRIAYELYDPCLTIKENADKLSCSVASLKKHFKIKSGKNVSFIFFCI